MQLPDILHMTLWRKEVIKTMKKVRENTLKSRKDIKVEELKKKDQIVLISNKLIQPDKQNHYLNYHKLIILKKGEQKEHFKVKRKVIEKKRNYCKVIVMSKQDNKHILQKGEI